MQFEPIDFAKRSDSLNRIIGGGVVGDPNNEIITERESTLSSRVIDTLRDCVGAIPGHDVNENSSLRHT
jgi:hypothetical protein